MIYNDLQALEKFWKRAFPQVFDCLLDRLFYDFLVFLQHTQLFFSLVVTVEKYIE